MWVRVSSSQREKRAFATGSVHRPRPPRPSAADVGHHRSRPHGRRIRDLDSDESRIDRGDITKELGDVLWYVAVLADYLDLSLDDIVTANLAKLASRQGRGVLSSGGDDR